MVLKEVINKIFNQDPVFTYSEKNLAHNRKLFYCQLKVNGNNYTLGVGKKKKESKQDACKLALVYIFNYKEENQSEEEEDH